MKAPKLSSDNKTITWRILFKMVSPINGVNENINGDGVTNNYRRTSQSDIGKP